MPATQGGSLLILPPPRHPQRSQSHPSSCLILGGPPRHLGSPQRTWESCRRPQRWSSRTTFQTGWPTIPLCKQARIKRGQGEESPLWQQKPAGRENHPTLQRCRKQRGGLTLLHVSGCWLNQGGRGGAWPGSCFHQGASQGTGSFLKRRQLFTNLGSLRKEGSAEDGSHKASQKKHVAGQGRQPCPSCQGG